MSLRRGILSLAALVLVLMPIGASTAAGPLFSENFEGSLAAKWTGRGGSGTSGVIVNDPIRAGNHVLSFTQLASGGDIFTGPIAVSKTKKYRLTFDYLGKAGSGGGIVGVSLQTPGHHRWLVGTTTKGAGETNPLVDDGKWHRYNVDFSPGDHTWFTPDGARAVDPGAITSLRIMVEANWGVPRDAYFDNFTLSACAATCAGGAGEEPVKVDIRFHANNLPTAPPTDGGQCPGPGLKASRVTGTITAQITPNGDHQGGGDVVDTPHLSRCRVPVINIRVDHVQLQVVEPGKVLRAILKVHISQEGVHRPGQCKVGTRGTITATYDDTSRALNSLRNHRLQIGPWSGPCSAHNHVITNNITAITADSSSSTWVRVWIGCLGPGYSPRNCDV